MRKAKGLLAAAICVGLLALLFLLLGPGDVSLRYYLWRADTVPLPRSHKYAQKLWVRGEEMPTPRINWEPVGFVDPLVGDCYRLTADRAIVETSIVSEDMDFDVLLTRTTEDEWTADKIISGKPSG